VQSVVHEQPALTAPRALLIGLVVGERAGGARDARRGVDGAGPAVRAAGGTSQQLLASRADDCRDVCGPGTCQEGVLDQTDSRSPTQLRTVESVGAHIDGTKADCQQGTSDLVLPQGRGADIGI